MITCHNDLRLESDQFRVRRIAFRSLHCRDGRTDVAYSIVWWKGSRWPCNQYKTFAVEQTCAIVTVSAVVDPFTAFPCQSLFTVNDFSTFNRHCRSVDIAIVDIAPCAAYWQMTAARTPTVKIIRYWRTRKTPVQGGNLWATISAKAHDIVLLRFARTEMLTISCERMLQRTLICARLWDIWPYRFVAFCR